MLSLIIPVYNEKEAIVDTVHSVHDVLSRIGMPFEILVVNDGSTDGSAEILNNLSVQGMTVITHPVNRGYGASMKTALRRAKGDIVGIIDADGTYPINDFPKLLKTMKESGADMVVGARTKQGVQIPWVRRPAKAVVNMLANSLTGIRIPDNNSGMRVFRRSMALEFMHLYPQGFSFTITITLAALTSDYLVLFVPIDYFKRKGTSSMSSGFNGIRNFLTFLGLIVRIVTYFRPLQFFAWPSAILMVVGLIYAVDTLVYQDNISDASVLILLTGLQIGLFGLLAEVVVRQCRASKFSPESY
ncbi:glycosyltransferase family 2 protein [Candidatus Peregrinibacteria bacterium]|nr:glycosyltransferase family 2 protein [Candidatus Peregrinibacteria bacterium]